MNATRDKNEKMRRWPKSRKQTMNFQDFADNQVINYLGGDDGQDNIDNIVSSSEWVQLSSIVDSGAAENVAPHSAAAHIRTQETEASRRGACFYAANGEALPNKGEKHIPVVTEEGQMTKMRYQIADVVRPLCSVSKICVQDNVPVFSAQGGYIYNNPSGRVTKFPRQNGVYVLKTWMQAPTNQSELVFTGPER